MNPVPLPISDPIAQQPNPNVPKGQKDTQAGLISDKWAKYFNALIQNVADTPTRLTKVALKGQGASITTTPLNLGQLNGGLYRLTYYAHVTRAATVSSSLTISFNWTDGGVSLTTTGAAMTGNTTGTYQSGTQTFNVDNNTPINYSTTYASAGATSMLYSLYVIVEAVAV